MPSIVSACCGRYDDVRTITPPLTPSASVKPVDLYRAHAYIATYKKTHREEVAHLQRKYSNDDLQVTAEIVRRHLRVPSQHITHLRPALNELVKES